LKPNPLHSAVGSISLSLVDAFRRRVAVDHPVVFPHLVFAALYRTNRSVFEQHLIPGGVGQVPRLWDSMAGHPALAGHPMTAVPDWQQWCIPLSVHGDGVPVTGIGKAWTKGVEAHV
jgi:hypothetical protein